MMYWLQQINSILQKGMPLITPLAVVTGVLLADWLAPLEFLVPWIFAVMTFSGSLGSNFMDLKRVMHHPLPLIISLLILHLVMPLLSFGVGHLVFYDDPYFVTGFILAFIIPTGITSLIWVSVHKGNVVLTLSIILIDTLLAPFIVPGLLYLFIGSAVQMNGTDIMIGLFWMVVIPSLFGMGLNQWTNGKAKDHLAPALAPFSKIGIGMVVAINSSAAAAYFRNIDWQLVLVGLVVLCMAIIGYALGWLSSKGLNVNEATAISLMYNNGMRNISAGAVIAITYFPAPVTVPVIAAMLFQQVLASFSGGVVERLLTHHENNLSRIENL
ncbi:Predicted Na+-dependent transporter [Salinibacillus kushneri]|uniref:Predicted Na+-dependent transporter n=1 Tax=Salinibacillus kushneri TaxID=237682 RepID=A0A1I0CJQ4_9BACI|nr:bile acid:sodium symporter family protein [Salinibacillus kushneri]SET19211.1 Predicted Na+-dependent transporter [Salinibacillus kushneri]